MRRSRLLLPILLLAAACGGTPPVTTVVVAVPSAQPAPTAAPAAPLPPLDPSLPAGSAAVLSIDTDKLGALFNGVAHEPPAVRAALARALGLAQGTLTHREVVEVLALDRARPIMASLWLTEGARAAVARVRAVHARAPAEGVIVGEVRHALEGVTGAALALRLVLPTIDVAVTLRAAGERLDRKGWKSETSPEGFEHFYASSENDSFAGLSRGPSTVVVDAVFPLDVTDRRRARAAAIEALRALRRRSPEGPHDEPPDLEGAVARARYAPAALADVGFLDGVSRVVNVMSGVEDDAHRGLAVKQRLDEAARSYDLLGDPRGAFFDRIELWIEGGYGSIAGGVRAVPGPATQATELPWAPGVGATIPPVFAWLDLSLPWLRGWAFPGADARGPERLRETIRQAGEIGSAIAFPHLLTATAAEPVRWFREHPGLDRRLERAAYFVAADGAPEAYFGILAQGITPADAACVLVEPPAPCTPDKKLSTSAAVHLDDRYVKLAQSKGRWTILASSDVALVEKTKIDLAPAPVAPARLAIPGRLLLAKELRPLPPLLFAARYLAEASLEAGQPTLRIRPAPAP